MLGRRQLRRGRGLVGQDSGGLVLQLCLLSSGLGGDPALVVLPSLKAPPPPRSELQLHTGLLCLT